jgi:hypothetical protein
MKHKSIKQNDYMVNKKGGKLFEKFNSHLGKNLGKLGIKMLYK